MLALWIPVIGERLLSQREPDNPEDKYDAYVKKENKIVGHLLLGNSVKFDKTIFYFLRANEVCSCKVIMTGKMVFGRW